jgi:hypothetical protein
MLRSLNLFVLAVAGMSLALPVDTHAQNLGPFLGTWKMDMGKSAAPGPPSTSNTNKLEAVGNGFHFVEENVDAQGGVMRIEYTVESFDGKDYPWKMTREGKPVPIADAIAFQKVDDHTYELMNKNMGKVIMTQKWVLSNDGKTRTVTMNSKDAKGQATVRTLVYEKQ